ncbi:MAG: tetratricopeptide repeat protein [Elusimicrobiota bacterium]
MTAAGRKNLQKSKQAAAPPWWAIVAGVVVLALAAAAALSRGAGEIETFAAAAPADTRQAALGGDRHFEAGRYAEAIKLYRKALELDPADADTRNDLGLALHYTGRSEEAVKELVEATETEPSFKNAWLSLGFVLTSLGRNEEARPALRHVIELAPGSPQAKEAQRMLEGKQ